MKIAIVDDDKACRERVKTLLKGYIANNRSLRFQIDLFESGHVFLNANFSQYDIVYLDIEMDIDGTVVANELHRTNNNVIIFYMTAHTHHVTKAIKYYAFQFLPKPIKDADFLSELERAIILYNGFKIKVSFKRNGYTDSVDICDLVYVESRLKDTVFHMRDDVEYVSNERLSKFVDLLKSKGFFQCHKSYLVNMRYIQRIDSKQAITMQRYLIPISHSKYAEFKQTYHSYISGVSL